jgi:hypothetical protein
VSATRSREADPESKSFFSLPMQEILEIAAGDGEPVFFETAKDPDSPS